jgi:hypothetical protein
VSGHAKMPPASHQVSATSLKLLIQQIHSHVRVERDSGMCVAGELYELWGRSPYTRMFVARTAAFVHVLVLLAAGFALCFGESIKLT